LEKLNVKTEFIKYRTICLNTMHISSKNFGLPRFSLFTLGFDFLLLLFSWWWCSRIFVELVGLLLIHLLLLYKYSDITKRGDNAILLALFIGLGSFMWFNYETIGLIDRALGGLPTYDKIIAQIDEVIFGTNVAHFFYTMTLGLAWFQRVIYEILIYAYFSYYILPFILMALYFYSCEKAEERLLLGRLVASIYILNALISCSYLIVPVTGPIYFLKQEFSYPLPFFWLGQAISDFINRVHPNFIDCFPSGHAAMAYILAYWSCYLRLKERAFFVVVAILMTFSTLFLRYHYFLDVVMAVLFVVASNGLARLIYPLKMVRPTKNSSR
jgi:membrane-associated phospholipid phosphatase